MSENSKIQWTDDTYNPWRGCTKVSAGCKNCYAEKLITTRLRHVHYAAATADGGKRTSKQFHPTGGPAGSGIQFWGKGSPRIRAVNLEEPLRWNEKPWVCDDCGHAHTDKPNRLFCDNCNGHAEKQASQLFPGKIIESQVTKLHRRRVFSLSLGDWLDDEVPIEWLADFLDVVRRCNNLDWLLVTKRPELWASRIEAVLKWLEANDCKWPVNKTSSLPLRDYLADWLVLHKAPANVMLLTSVEDQLAAAKRIPELLKIPAARRGLSCEPLLGPVDIQAALNKMPFQIGGGNAELHWIIVGGESGPDARPCNFEWIRRIKDDCTAAGVPVFVKQLGANSYVPAPNGPITEKGGDMDQWPAYLRVREFYK